MPGQAPRSVAWSPTLDTAAGGTRVSNEHVATAVVMATGISQAGPEAPKVLIGGVRALAGPLIGRD